MKRNFLRIFISFLPFIISGSAVALSDDVEDQLKRYINEKYAQALPCMSRMDVSAADGKVTVLFPKLACVTDASGEILTSSLQGGTVTSVDYVERKGVKASQAKVQNDGSVTLEFTVNQVGPDFRIIDPAFKRGNVQGWIGPSSKPEHQFVQMHGGHIVSALVFYDGKLVEFTPVLKELICLLTPSNDSEGNNPNKCRSDLQPQIAPILPPLKMEKCQPSKIGCHESKE